jgi:hypothetical protein
MQFFLLSCLPYISFCSELLSDSNFEAKPNATSMRVA